MKVNPKVIKQMFYHLIKSLILLDFPFHVAFAILSYLSPMHISLYLDSWSETRVLMTVFTSCNEEWGEAGIWAIGCSCRFMNVSTIESSIK